MFTIERLSNAARTAMLMGISLMLLTLSLPPVQAKTPTSSASGALTKKERDYAIEYLKVTRQKLLKEISGLSEAQLNFKPNPIRWSIAQIAEHIILGEDALFSLVTERILKSPAADGKTSAVKDTAILEGTRDRTRRFTAPGVVRPAQKWTAKSDLVKEFETRRERSIAYIEKTSDDLRSHFLKNAVFNEEIDAYQWLLFLGGHCERHTAQIIEMKADPGSPRCEGL